MGYRAWGDSLTVGVNAQPISTNSFIHLLEAALGSTIDNQAVSSSQAGNQGALMESVISQAGDTHLVMLGSNDFRKYKSDTIKRGYFEKALMQAIVALLTPMRKTRANGGLTLTGTWTSSGNWNRSTQLGAKATATVNGSTVYVAFQIQDSATPNGQATVKVDGVQKAVISSNGVGCGTFLGVDYFPTAIRIDGLSPGSHTVEIEVTSSGQYQYIDWIAGNDQAVSPTLFVSTLPKMSDARYTSDGTSDSLLQSYNTYISALIQQLQADGFNITLVDIYGTLIPSTGLDTDGIHLNNAGEIQVKDALLAAINGSGPSVQTITYPMSNGMQLELTLIQCIVSQIKVYGS